MLARFVAFARTQEVFIVKVEIYKRWLKYIYIWTILIPLIFWAFVENYKTKRNVSSIAKYHPFCVPSFLV